MAMELGSMPPSLALMHLLHGATASHVINIAAKLGIADKLRDGPRSSDELARELGAHADALHRVLRCLVFYGLLQEAEHGRFALAPRGELLRSDHPESMLDLVLMAEVSCQAMSSLGETVKTGVPAFRIAFGHDFYEHLTVDADAGARFARFMARQTQLIARMAVATYDFSEVCKLVDVGGGLGHFVAAVLRANPAAEGVVFDLPSVIAQADAFLTAEGVAARCALESGDFFESVPAGGDAYLLSRVLHNWDDPAAVRILTHCRRALGDRGRMLVIEHISPERVEDDPMAILMDIAMLTLRPGRERTLQEYRALFAQAGFALARTVPLPAPGGGTLSTILEVVPAMGAA